MKCVTRPLLCLMYSRASSSVGRSVFHADSPLPVKTFSTGIFWLAAQSWHFFSCAGRLSSLRCCCFVVLTRNMMTAAGMTKRVYYSGSLNQRYSPASLDTELDGCCFRLPQKLLPSTGNVGD